MDFKRIERILILAFFLLNLFLLSIVFEQNNFVDFSSQSPSINVLDEMESNNIVVEALDQKELALPYIQTEDHQLLAESAPGLPNQTGQLSDDGKTYVAILSSPIELSEEEELTKEDRQKIDDFVRSSAVMYGDHYQFFDYHPQLQEIIYTQMVGDIPIADGSSSIRFILDSQNNIVSYEQTFAGPTSEQGQDVALITDQAAVETLFQNNKIPSGSQVLKPRLSYHRTLELDDLSMYIPVWLVQMKHSGKIIEERVNATNGTIIVPTLPPPSDEEEESSSQ